MFLCMQVCLHTLIIGEMHAVDYGCSINLLGEKDEKK